MRRNFQVSLLYFFKETLSSPIISDPCNYLLLNNCLSQCLDNVCCFKAIVSHYFMHKGKQYSQDPRNPVKTNLTFRWNCIILLSTIILVKLKLLFPDCLLFSSLCNLKYIECIVFSIKFYSFFYSFSEQMFTCLLCPFKITGENGLVLCRKYLSKT